MYISKVIKKNEIMSSVLREVESLTNQSNLSFGISDMSDAELLVQSLPKEVKDNVKSNLALPQTTSDSELARLIIDNLDNQNLERPIETDFDIDDIDIESIKPFEGDAEGQSSVNLNIEDILDNPELQDMDVSEMNGQGNGDSDSDSEGDGQGEGDSDSEGDSEGQEQGDSQQEKIENELLDFGYQPLYPYFGEIINNGDLDENDSEKRYSLKKTTDYVDIVNILTLENDKISQFINITNEDFSLEFGIQASRISSDTKDFTMSALFLFVKSERNDFDVSENDDLNKKTMSDNRVRFDIDEIIGNVRPQQFSNEFNSLYKKYITYVNKALISEAEVNQKFLQNIND